MSSWESERGRRAARFYGPAICRATRAERVAFINEQIAALDKEIAAAREAKRAAIVAKHGAGSFQSKYASLEDELEFADLGMDKDEFAGYEKRRFVQGLIDLEKADEEYAAHARDYGVKRENHIDGFCRYWQNVRHRLFEAVGTRARNAANTSRSKRIIATPAIPPSASRRCPTCRRYAGAAMR